MIRRMGSFFAGAARRFLPDAFVFAVILTILTFVLGMIVQRASFTEMASHFGKGIWSFLAFSMQMVLVLVTGSALATSAPVSRLVGRAAGLPRTPSQAVMLATVAMIVGCWLNWGFGLVASALLARELARRVRGVHYPLLVASAYSGFVVWHAGLSGSIPLKIAGTDEILSRFTGGVTVPASQTIFAWQNLLLVLVFLATIPPLNALMHPRRGEEIEAADDPAPVDRREGDEDADCVDARRGEAARCAQRLERSSILSLAIGAICVSAIAVSFVRGAAIDLDTVIFIFLTLGLLLHRTPIRYVRAVNEAVRSCGGIVLQFPIYAGIMGMMIESGLAVTLSELFVGISTRSTFPLFTYLSAGIVNIFVPSGGGQWAVQGPIMIPAAKALGVPYATTAMAIAWGDAWTNLVQPFWALPLLAVAKLPIREIMGYTAVILIYAGIVTSLFMLFVF